MANHPSTSTYVIKNRPFPIENADPAQPIIAAAKFDGYWCGID